MSPTPKTVRIYHGTKVGQAERLPEEGVVSVITTGESTDSPPASLGASDDVLQEMVERQENGGVSLDTARE